jgi:hypothetical protein
VNVACARGFDKNGNARGLNEPLLFCLEAVTSLSGESRLWVTMRRRREYNSSRQSARTASGRGTYGSRIPAFERLFALASSTMGPPAAAGMLERRTSCAAETLHDIPCSYRNPHEFSFSRVSFYHRHWLTGRTNGR